MSDANQVRINELARELEVKAKAIIDLLPGYGVTEKKTHSSSIPVDVAEKVRKNIWDMAEAEAPPKPRPKRKKKPRKRRRRLRGCGLLRLSRLRAASVRACGSEAECAAVPAAPPVAKPAAPAAPAAAAPVAPKARLRHLPLRRRQRAKHRAPAATAPTANLRFVLRLLHLQARPAAPRSDAACCTGGHTTVAPCGLLLRLRALAPCTSCRSAALVLPCGRCPQEIAARCHRDHGQSWTGSWTTPRDSRPSGPRPGQPMRPSSNPAREDRSRRGPAAPAVPANRDLLSSVADRCRQARVPARVRPAVPGCCRRCPGQNAAEGGARQAALYAQAAAAPASRRGQAREEGERKLHPTRQRPGAGGRALPQRVIAPPEPRPPRDVTITEGITIRELAEKLDVRAKELLKSCWIAAYSPASTRRWTCRRPRVWPKRSTAS